MHTALHYQGAMSSPPQDTIHSTPTPTPSSSSDTPLPGAPRTSLSLYHAITKHIIRCHVFQLNFISFQNIPVCSWKRNILSSPSVLVPPQSPRHHTPTSPHYTLPRNVSLSLLLQTLTYNIFPSTSYGKFRNEIDFLSRPVPTSQARLSFLPSLPIYLKGLVPSWFCADFAFLLLSLCGRPASLSR